MTPAAAPGVAGGVSAGICRLQGGHVRGVVAEQFLDLVPAPLQAAQRQAEVGDAVPHRVVGIVAADGHQQAALVGPRPQTAAGQFPLQPRQALLHLDDQRLASLGEGVDRVRPQQAARLDGDQVIADPLDLAEQVRGDHDRDAELLADRRDQLEHGVAAGGVEPIGRLIEQHQPRIADQRLGELYPLLHAGRVAADLAVPLLVQADVPQRLGGALPGRGGRQPGHAAHVRDELGRRDVRRQAVVLGHVADELADPHAVLDAVQAEHLRHAWVGSSRPRRTLMSVDFPAPLAPISPVTPGAKLTVRPSRAVTSPGYTLDSAAVSMTAATSPSGNEGIMALSLPGARPLSVPLHGEKPAEPGTLRGLRPWDEARPGICGYRRSVVSEGDMSYPRPEPPALPAYPDAGPGRRSRPPRPPLTKRMRRGHWIALDCVAGGLAAVAEMALVGQRPGIVAVPAVLLLGVAVFVPVALRRLAPVAAFGALIILAVLLAAEGFAPGVVFLAAAYVLYLVTATSNRQTSGAALGLALVVMVLIMLADHRVARNSGAAGLLIPAAFALIVCWIAGYSMRQRRLYAQMLQEQATSSAVAEERLRIARELHDVVAHSMSVIAVQAGYGQYVIDSSPSDARDALGAIQATSRDALEEMRRMLGVLRQQDVTQGPAMAGPATGQEPAGQAPVDGQAPAGGGTTARQAPLAPAPGLARLDQLIERTRGAAVRVRLEVSGHPRPAPAGVDLSAYRIVQEALTNGMRHAGTGAACVVHVGYTDADLVIRVTDDGGLPVALPSISVAAAGGGHGIIGMRERVFLCSGTFSAGPLPDGGF